jgi:putative restriction endonuclease
VAAGERDEGLRTACFLALDVLRAQFGDELPYRGAMERGFAFRGLPRVPFLNFQKGIYRAAAQTGPAALSIQTSAETPYADAATEEGFLYSYRAGSPDGADNRALRAASDLGVPLVYFVATRPGVYEALYPCYVIEDRREERCAIVAVGRRVGPVDELEPVPIVDPVERRYAAREVKVRLHQRRFRWQVIPAYREQCAVCRLKEVRLLDAAHIVGDPEPTGTPEIANGLSLCSIHHRSFDQNLVGVSPDYQVHVANRLLKDEDGPMLDLLKGFEGQTIELPRRVAWRPDRDRLAIRFERFLAASGS